jgi:hypothetical protein
MSILEQRDRLVAEYCGSEPRTADQIRRHFAHHLKHPALEPLPKPCQDCAVTCGLYTGVSAYLSLLPQDEVKIHSDRWFCHNHGDRACRGNINYQRAVLLSNGKRGGGE